MPKFKIPPGLYSPAQAAQFVKKAVGITDEYLVASIKELFKEFAGPTGKITGASIEKEIAAYFMKKGGTVLPVVAAGAGTAAMAFARFVVTNGLAFGAWEAMSYLISDDAKKDLEARPGEKARYAQAKKEAQAAVALRDSGKAMAASTSASKIMIKYLESGGSDAGTKSALDEAYKWAGKYAADAVNKELLLAGIKEGFAKKGKPMVQGTAPAGHQGPSNEAQVLQAATRFARVIPGLSPIEALGACRDIAIVLGMSGAAHQIAQLKQKLVLFSRFS